MLFHRTCAYRATCGQKQNSLEIKLHRSHLPRTIPYTTRRLRLATCPLLLDPMMHCNPSRQEHGTTDHCELAGASCNACVDRTMRGATPYAGKPPVQRASQHPTALRPTMWCESAVVKTCAGWVRMCGRPREEALSGMRVGTAWCLRVFSTRGCTAPSPESFGERMTSHPRSSDGYPRRFCTPFGGCSPVASVCHSHAWQ